MKSEKGFSLVEVIIAIALIGIIAVAFLGALATGSRAIFIADERATAESLARTQMEYVKNQDYVYAADYDPGVPGSGEVIYEKIDESEIPEGYTIMSIDRDGDAVENIIGVPWDPDPQINQALSVDAGLQKITVLVYHLYAGDPNDYLVMLEGYKLIQ
jgi:prepilin-type N-terminal cleavage/methylation domain-containing protein